MEESLTTRLNELRSFLDYNHIQVLSEEETSLSYFWILNVRQLNPLYLQKIMQITPVGVIVLHYEGSTYLGLAVFKDVNIIK